jgi:AcrR family transcriptional regulator
VPPTRRERMRDATLREIKEAARVHLRAEGPSGISLRAIARDMGMTAPALYRYYAGLDDLVAALVDGYTDEISDAMEAARDALPPDETGDRLVAVTRAFRRWSLDHRAEYALVFGAPLPGFADAEHVGHAAGARFGGVFFALIAELWHRKPFPIPSEEDIPADLRAELRTYAISVGPDVEGLPLGVVRLYVAAWIKLYGLVTMEVFGHARFMFEDTDALFEAELIDLGVTLGLFPEHP